MLPPFKVVRAGVASSCGVQMEGSLGHACHAARSGQLLPMGSRPVGSGGGATGWGGAAVTGWRGLRALDVPDERIHFEFFGPAEALSA